MNKELARPPRPAVGRSSCAGELDSATRPSRRTGLAAQDPQLLGPGRAGTTSPAFSDRIAPAAAEDAASGYAEIQRHVLDYRSGTSLRPTYARRRRYHADENPVPKPVRRRTGRRAAPALSRPRRPIYNAAIEDGAPSHRLGRGVRGIDDGIGPSSWDSSPLRPRHPSHRSRAVGAYGKYRP